MTPACPTYGSGAKNGWTSSGQTCEPPRALPARGGVVGAIRRLTVKIRDGGNGVTDKTVGSSRGQPLALPAMVAMSPTSLLGMCGIARDWVTCGPLFGEGLMFSPATVNAFLRICVSGAPFGPWLLKR